MAATDNGTPVALQSADDDGFAVTEIDKLRFELQWTQSNLQQLSNGIRLLTSQMMNKHKQNQVEKKEIADDDNTTQATAEITLEESISATGSFEDAATTKPMSSTSAEYAAHTEQSFSADNLAPLPAIADLLALHNVTQMVQDHANLASLEATTAVNDAIQAQQAARYWQKRALFAEAELAPVKSEACRYKTQSQKLRVERKLLVREVRKCRKEIAEKDKESVFSQLEAYVTSALNIHEHQLKTPKASNHPPLTPTSSTEEGREEEVNETVLVETSCEAPAARPRLSSFGLPFPLPGAIPNRLRAYSKESPQSPDTPTKQTEIETTACLSPSPRESGDISSVVVHQDSFGSPITFLESPPGAQPATYGDDTVADPNVLRSLALPSAEQ